MNIDVTEATTVGQLCAAVHPPIPPPVVPVGTVRVVSPTGLDTNAGTEAAPWKTLGKAATAAPADCTIYLRGGIYDETVTFEKPRTRIESYPGEWAIVTSPTTDGIKRDWCIRFGINADDCSLRRVELVGGAYYCLKSESNWDWSGPYVHEQRHGTSRLLVEDCKLHGSGRDCIKLTPGSDQCTIRRCEIWGSGQRATNAEGIDAVNCDNLTLQDLFVHDTRTTGIYVKGGSIKCLIERCKVVNAIEGHGIMLGFYTDLDFFDPESNPNNYENLYGVVRNCHIEGTAYCGLAAFSALRPEFYHNTVLRAARLGFSAFHVNCGNAMPPTWATGTEIPSKNVVAVNNIFQADPTGNRPVAEIRVNGLVGSLVLKNNRYDAMGGPVVFEDDRPNPKFSGNLAAWQAHTGTDVGSLAGDLKLGTDNRPLADSPCRNAAVKMPDMLLDMTGRARAGVADVGAYEGA